LNRILKITSLIIIIALSLNAKDYVIENKGIKCVVKVDETISITSLENRYTGQNYKINYDNDFYIRNNFELSTKAHKRNISTIEVERMIIDGVDISYPSYVFKGNTAADGPVYADNFFIGIEFPKQDNSMDGKYLRLKHFPSKNLSNIIRN